MVPNETHLSRLPSVRVLLYDKQSAEFHEEVSVDEALAMRRSGSVLWIDVCREPLAPAVSHLAEHLNIHQLFVEDVLNENQRGKVEEIDGVTLIVCNVIECHRSKTRDPENISILLGDGFVVTVQATEEDPLARLRQGLMADGHFARQRGADFLASEIVSVLIDNFYDVMETVTADAAKLEEQVFERPTRSTLVAIHDLRKDLLLVRRCVWPYRETLTHLSRDSYAAIDSRTRKYFRDAYDNSVMVIDLIESTSETAGSLFGLYSTVIGNRLNGTMRMLTALSAIFIPLNFVAGVYGMNFNTGASKLNMPELNWRYGYLGALSLMALIGFGQLAYFWRKGWLFDRDA